MEAKGPDVAGVSRACILLGGQPRSGTTLLASILGSAPGHVQAYELHVRKPSFVVGLEGRYTRNLLTELGLPSETYDRIVGTWDTSRMNLGAWAGPVEEHSAEPVTGSETERFEEELVARCELVEALMAALCMHVGSRSWGIKILADVAFADKYAKAWPAARVIHAIRDPRDQALSVLGLNEQRRERGQPPFYESVRDAAEGWRQNLLAGREAVRRAGLTAVEVRYEELARRPEAVLQDLEERIGLDGLVASVDAFHRSAVVQKHARRFRHHDNVLRPINTSRIGKWKTAMEPEDRAAVAEICGDLMTELGYEP